jgi:hypothetical protein
MTARARPQQRAAAVRPVLGRHHRRISEVSLTS